MRSLLFSLIASSTSHAQVVEALADELTAFDSPSYHLRQVIRDAEQMSLEVTQEHARVVELAASDPEGALTAYEESRPLMRRAASAHASVLALSPNDRIALSAEWELVRMLNLLGQYQRAAHHAANVRDRSGSLRVRREAAQFVVDVRARLVEQWRYQGFEPRREPWRPFAGIQSIPVPAVLLEEIAARDALANLDPEHANVDFFAHESASLFYLYGHRDEARNRLRRLWRRSCMRSEYARSAAEMLRGLVSLMERKRITGEMAFCTFGATSPPRRSLGYHAALLLLSSAAIQQNWERRTEQYLAAGLAFTKILLRTGERPTYALSQARSAFEAAEQPMTPYVRRLFLQAQRLHCP